MTIHTRLLSGVLLAVVATAGPVAAQYGSGGYLPPAQNSVVPSVAPPWNPDPRPGGGVPGRLPPTTPLERVTSPVRTAAGEASDPVGTLTGQPAVHQENPGLRPGSYPSPYFTDGPGCCGPLGRNGRIGYELYAYTGPAWALGEGALARRLNTGWLTGGGGRSLFFNTTHDAAWVADLGLSYQYNRGSTTDPVTVFLRRPPVNVGTQNVPQADALGTTLIRGLHRTNFNFAVGRDWWYWGPGSVGLEESWNLRCGGLIGGRWGTAHVDFVPTNVAAFGDYQRKQGVTHGLFLASHATVEVPMGTWVGFVGLRGELGYDWMNLVAPRQGNLYSMNLLITAGLRF